MTGPMDQHAQLETLRRLLKQLGVTPEQLLADATAASVVVPTFGEYVWQVAEAVSPGTRRVYSSYRHRICQHWGTRRITEPTPLEIKRLAEEIRGEVVVRRNARGGRTAAEHLIAAMRCIYRHAVMDAPSQAPGRYCDQRRGRSCPPRSTHRRCPPLVGTRHPMPVREVAVDSDPADQHQHRRPGRPWGSPAARTRRSPRPPPPRQGGHPQRRQRVEEVFKRA